MIEIGPVLAETIQAIAWAITTGVIFWAVFRTY